MRPGATTGHLTFYRQPAKGAVAYDPAHGYLPYAAQAKHPSKSGDTYSFTLTTDTARPAPSATP